MTLLRPGLALALVTVFLLGCKTSQVAVPAPLQPRASLAEQPLDAPSIASAPAAYPPLQVAPVQFQEPLPPLASFHAADPLPQGETLSRHWLAAEIEARNPSLEAMVAAWQAASQRFPQQIALDDPVLMGMIAPQSAASSATETAYALQLNQKIPWRGKRPLRGEAADAQADAAFHDAEDTRLQVRLLADLAFYDYYLAARLLDINRQNSEIMQQFRDTAQSRYRTSAVSQQDILQADVELAELDRRRLEILRMHRVATARINTLLRRWPDTPLPPAPAELDERHQPEDVDLLWQTALRERPDFAALAWRVQADEAALELAYKNFYPDLDVFGRYDTFWQPASTQGPLRAQVGVAMNLPVYREKLRAAVCEAQFRLAQRRAEFEQRSLEIQYDVVAAAAQVEESRQAVELYAQRLVPIAAQNVAAVRANYTASKATFIELAQARRQEVMLLERQLEAIVAYHRRRSELDRAVGVR